MAISQTELGKRLEMARIACGLTTPDVAETLEISEAVLLAIESGSQPVSGIELDMLAKYYQRNIAAFFEENFESDPTYVLLRAVSSLGIPEGSIASNDLLMYANRCQKITFLEGLLGLPASPLVPLTYALRPPAGRWNAIQQGMSLAEQERKRLRLAAWPIKNLAEIIRRQGVRVIEHQLPQNISGLFFHGRKPGLAIIINDALCKQSKLLACAHEYCHVLVDRKGPSNISHSDNKEELFELRASSFAAHFLMPEEGIRDFFSYLGKGEVLSPTTEVLYSFEAVGELSAMRRLPPHSQEVGLHDVVQLSHYYGLTFETTLYQLLNLRFLNKERYEELKYSKDKAQNMKQIFGWQSEQEEKYHSEKMTTKDQLLELAFEAYRRGILTKKELFEYTDELEISRKAIEETVGDETNAIDPISPL